jgi:hypothetical protein
MKKGVFISMIVGFVFYCSVVWAFDVPTVLMKTYNNVGTNIQTMMENDNFVVEVKETTGNKWDVSARIEGITIEAKTYKIEYAMSGSQQGLSVEPLLVDENFNIIDRDIPIVLSTTRKSFFSILKSKNNSLAHIVFWIGGSTGRYVFHDKISVVETVDNTPDLTVNILPPAIVNLEHIDGGRILVDVIRSESVDDVNLMTPKMYLDANQVYLVTLDVESETNNPILCSLFNREWVFVDSNKSYCSPGRTILSFLIKNKEMGEANLMFKLGGLPGKYTIGNYTVEEYSTEIVENYSLLYSAGDGGSVSGDCIQTVKKGEKTTDVTAVPNCGYHFVRWSDGVLTALRNDVNLASNINVMANFAKDPFRLEYKALANGSISGQTSQTVNEGADGTEVIASPDRGYIFLYWSDGVLTPKRKDNAILQSISVFAIFQKRPSLESAIEALQVTAGVRK